MCVRVCVLVSQPWCYQAAAAVSLQPRRRRPCVNKQLKLCTFLRLVLLSVVVLTLQYRTLTCYFSCVSFIVIMNQTCDSAPSAAESKKEHDN